MISRTLSQTQSTPQRPNLSLQARKSRWFYIFVSPWLIGFVLLTVIPLGAALGMSFTNFDGLNSANLRFVGFDNYTAALSDHEAWFALTRTLVFALLNVPLTLIVALCLAFMLTQRIFAQGIFRTFFYIPSIIPIVAVAWVWKLMMNNNFGLVNAALDVILPGTYVRWMTEYPTFVLVLLSLWIGTGGTMLIFLAGLQGVPKELEEAARIDGANFIQVFFAITIPFLSPVIFYQLILGILGSLQVLVQPLLLAPTTGRGVLATTPPRDNYVFMVHVFQEIFGSQRYGYGSALLWLFFILILALTLVVFYTGRYWVYYEVEQ
ncbi:MAG: sugar ABC transporter permease [Chitinophagaceae bacterium]|nr:sugar ABC transporter permease [Anaerolineae bacterium]